LLDSGLRARFARQFVKIIFACADVCAARDVDAKLNGRARKFFVARRRQRNTVVARSPYLIVFFCNRCAMRTTLRRAFAARNVMPRMRDVNDIAMRVAGRGYTLR
jgi:hypothetical protein